MANKARIALNVKDNASVLGMISALNRFGDTGGGRSIETEAKNTVARMRKDAPYDTGRLNRNIKYKKKGKGTVEFESIAKDPQTGEDYAPKQEHGIGVPPRPYFYKNVRKFSRDLAKNLRKRLKQIANKKYFN